MPKTLKISVDEFLDKRKLVSKDGLIYRAAKMPKTFNAETRSATFVMTDETKDSYGDIVRAKGCHLERFENNPICLLNHRSDLILGTWSDVTRIVRRIEGKATLAKAGTAPHVDMAFNLMNQGILRAASIGFMPLSVEMILDEDGKPTWSFDILEWDMYECSVVSIPANPNALAKSMRDGNMLCRDMLEDVLDSYIKTPAGLIVNIKEFEGAYKVGTGQRTIVTVDKALMPRQATILKAAGKGVELSAATSQEAQKYTGAAVKLKADHPENAGWPFDVIKDAPGEVIASWIVEEGENKGVHALAVEFLTNDFEGMFRGIKAERFLVLGETVVEETEEKSAEADDATSAELPTDEAIAKFVANVLDTDTIKITGGPDGKAIALRDGKEVACLETPGLTDDLCSELFDKLYDAVQARAADFTGSTDVQALDVSTIKIPDGSESQKTVTIEMDVDTRAATEKVNALSALIESVGAKLGKFFGSKADEPAPAPMPEPPSAEEIEAAKAKATATLERLASKGLI